MTNTSNEATVPTPSNDATDQASGTQVPADASPVEYSAGVVRLGNIHPEAPAQEEATPDITDKGDEDLDKKSFADFGVTDPIVDALEDKGITHPFPIQALTLGPALDRHDIIGQAKTGTGKTLGFGIPVLEDVIAPDEEGYEDLLNPNKPQALIILPTRELTKQVAQDLRDAAKYLSTRIVEIYGGVAFEPQIEALTRGADIVVGTPGRLIDLLRKGHLHLSGVETVVLDEADEMLDLGFLPDVETLLGRVPENRHTMLFSATMPGPVVALARRFMVHPTHIRAQDPDDQNQTVNTVKQVIYRVHAMNKVEVVARILQAEGRGRTVIFCRTKRTAARLGEDLTARGFAVGALHGDLGQGAREQALRAFRKGKVDVLVATDVAARGIDVDDVTHVINYQCPEDEKIYIHRIGDGGDVRGLGRHTALVAHLQGPGPGRAGSSRDLPHVPAPVHRPGHSGGHDGASPARQAYARRPGCGGLGGPGRFVSSPRGSRPWRPFGLTWRSRAFRTQRRFRSFFARLSVARVPGRGSHAERR